MYKFLSVKLQSIFDSPIRRAALESVMTGITGQAVLIISGIIVARALGPEGRGYMALLMVFPAILSQLGSLGLPQAATYFIARNDDGAKEVGCSIKRAFVIQAFILVIIHFFIVALYVRHEPREVIIVGYFTLAVIPGMLGQQYGLAVLQGERKYRLFNIMRLMPATLYAVGVMLIFLAGLATLSTITLTWVVMIVIVGFSIFNFSLRRVPGLRVGKQTERFPHFSRMLRFGLKGLIGTTSLMQNFRLDQLVAGLFLSPAALGLYVVGQAFTNIIRFIAQSAGMILYPSVAASGDNPAASRLIWRFFAGVSVLNGGVVLVLIALMPILVPFLFGKAFSESIPIARLLLVGTYFDSLRRILVEGMRGMGRPEVSTWSELAMYPFLCILLPLLISSSGLTGLTVAVLCGYAVSLVAAGLFFLRNRS